MDRSFKVAVVGATGLIGETLIELLEERDFPLSTLLPLASDRSLGHSVSFRGRSYPVAALAGFDFAQCELAFFCAGAAVARQYAPHAAAAGCIVIDSSGEFSGHADVPLVVPPLNAAALSRIGTSGIVASPRGASIALLLTLAPLHAAATATRIDLATYQAVSGAGRAALEELARQSIEALSGRGVTLQDEAGAQVAFNCVPQIEAFADNGYSAEELQIAAETRRVLAAPGAPRARHRGARACLLRRLHRTASRYAAAPGRGRGAPAAAKCAWRHGFGRAGPSRRLPHGGY